MLLFIVRLHSILKFGLRSVIKENSLKMVPFGLIPVKIILSAQQTTYI